MNVLGKKSTEVVLFFSFLFRAIDILTYMMKRLKPARVDKERRITPRAIAWKSVFKRSSARASTKEFL